jgi:hypothetical protein
MIGLVEKECLVDEEYQELISNTLQEAKLTQDLKSLVGAVVLVDSEPDAYWERDVIVAPIAWVKVSLYRVQKWFVPQDPPTEFRDEYVWIPRCSLEVHLMGNNPRIKYLYFCEHEGWCAAVKRRWTWPWSSKATRLVSVKVDVL